jgi:hypothetical protein
VAETRGARQALVLGCDPGTTTGLAVVKVGLGRQPKIMDSAQLEWDAAAWAVRNWLKMMAQSPHETLAACEKFMISAKTAQRGQGYVEDALGMVGVVRHYCTAHGVEMAPTESASAAERLVGDEAMRRLDVWQPGKKHANDAVRHAVLASVKRGWVTGGMLLYGAPG